MRLNIITRSSKDDDPATSKKKACNSKIEKVFICSAIASFS